DALLTAAEGNRLEALYVLALNTGMRTGEMLALQWPEVDLDGGTLRVRRTLHHAKGGMWHLTPPKTAKWVRELRLTADTMDALRAHHARQLAERMAAETWEDHGFVFTWRDGEPMRGTNVLQNDFRPLLKRAGLPPIRLHDLRHTAATLLLGAGI